MKYSGTQDILIYIRQQMIADKITMRELASRMHRTPGALSALFRQGNISLEMLNEICSALDYVLSIDIVRHSTDG